MDNKAILNFFEKSSQRFADYYTNLSETAETKMRGPQQKFWLEIIDTERENLRVVLSWSEETGYLQFGLRIIGALSIFWWHRGYNKYDQYLVDQLLASTEIDSTLSHIKVRALITAVQMARGQGNYAKAFQHAEESLGIARQLANGEVLALVLNSMGTLYGEQGEFLKSLPYFKESLEIRRNLHNEISIAHSLNNLSIISNEMGDLAAARCYVEESLAIYRNKADELGIANVGQQLALITTNQGDYATALPLLIESLLIQKKLENKHGFILTLEAFAMLSNMLGRTDVALTVLGAVEFLRTESNRPRTPIEQRKVEELFKSIKKSIGVHQFNKHLKAGKQLSIEEITKMVLHFQIETATEMFNKNS